MFLHHFIIPAERTGKHGLHPLWEPLLQNAHSRESDSSVLCTTAASLTKAKDVLALKSIPSCRQSNHRMSIPSTVPSCPLGHTSLHSKRRRCCLSFPWLTALQTLTCASRMQSPAIPAFQSLLRNPVPYSRRSSCPAPSPLG